jgi:hypothetical protein
MIFHSLIFKSNAQSNAIIIFIIQFQPRQFILKKKNKNIGKSDNQLSLRPKTKLKKFINNFGIKLKYN